MKNIRPLLSVLVTAGVALAQATALADTSANIEGYAVNSAVYYDGGGNFPIVTAVLSQPGTVDGYTYTSYAYFAADPYGSLDIFYSSSLVNSANWLALGGTSSYVPTVGDQIAVNGNWSPFDGIPEVANSTANPISVQLGSQGNPPYNPVPVVTTIPTINVGTTLPNGGGVNASGLAGTLIQLNNVTIGSSGNFPTHANLTTTVSDGANSMTLYFWASSYSTIGAMGGTPIPQGEVDITGFVDDFYTSSSNTTSAEFVPVMITEVPEPSAMALCGLGSALAWVGYRLRKKA